MRYNLYNAFVTFKNVISGGPTSASVVGLYDSFAKYKLVMKRIFTVILLVLLGTMILFAKVYTPQTIPNPRLVDASSNICNPDSILTAEEVAKLQGICDKIYSLSEVQLAVVTLKDIGEATAFDFALTLFNHWGVGSRQRNTGVLLFLATESRQVQIITGTGIEGVLPDAECSSSIDEMIDELKSNKFGPALITGAKSIGTKVTTQNALEELLLDSDIPEPNGQPWSGMANLLTLGLGLYGFYWMRKQKCPKCSKRTLKLIKSEVTRRATFSSAGQGVRHYRCTTCGHTFSESYSIPKKQLKSSGGGFSGGSFTGSSFSSGGSSFGGGSFGGGHSSGGGAGRSF